MKSREIFSVIILAMGLIAAILPARMIQHEFDHTKGVLYLDYLKPITQKMMESKLKKIVKGQVKFSYPMHFVEYK